MRGSSFGAEIRKNSESDFKKPGATLAAAWLSTAVSVAGIGPTDGVGCTSGLERCNGLRLDIQAAA
jgi:hypothetical protein